MDVAITISSGIYYYITRWALAGRNIDRILWVQ